MKSPFRCPGWARTVPRRVWSHGAPWIRRLAFVAALATALSGCLVDVDGDRVFTIACLGDSNTAVGWDDRPSRWCEYLAGSLSTAIVRSHGLPTSAPVKVANFARAGSSLCGPATRLGYSMTQLEEARAVHPDLILAAFGTNDTLFAITGDQYVGCARALDAAAAPVPVLFALAPLMMPQRGLDWTKISRFNAALLAAFPPSQLLDFADGFTAYDLDGPVHLKDDAERRRARIAREALARLSSPLPLR